MPPEKFFSILKHGFLIIKHNHLPQNIHALGAGNEAVTVLTIARKKAVIPAWAHLMIDEYEKTLLEKLETDDPMVTGESGWSEWRLILNGKAYPPLYKNQEEWAAAYKNKK